MITCQDARQLFDRYLDDELSPALQTEVHAHVLHCSECQNDLAIAEACGDVIRLDKCEPRLSGSFADRVLAASRPMRQVHAARARRLPWLIGAPMAAAACLALVFASQMPSNVSSPSAAVVVQPAVETPVVVVTSTPVQSVVAGTSIAAPQSVRDELTKLTDKKLSPEAMAELKATPEMPALSFLDALLAPVMQGTRNAVEGSKRTAQDLELLIRYGLTDMNEQLIADYRQKYPTDPTLQPATTVDELILLGPLSPQTETPSTQGEPAATSGESTGSPLPRQPI